MFGIIDGGITLPQAKYYLSTDPQLSHHRTVYSGIVREVLQLTGLTGAALTNATAGVMAVETQMARVTLPNEALRAAPPHHLTQTDINKLAPGCVVFGGIRGWGGCVGDDCSHMCLK